MTVAFHSVTAFHIFFGLLARMRNSHSDQLSVDIRPTGFSFGFLLSSQLLWVDFRFPLSDLYGQIQL